MKKFIFGLLLMVCSFPTLAEVVSSVSFNPSRMGEYTYLKVTDKANLKGGLDTPVLNIQSGGTVSMQTDSSSRLYEIPTVKGETNSRIDMPNTAFHGNTANTYSSYESESSTTPTGLLADVNVKGGTQTYKKDSYIQTLRAVNILKQKATTLKGGTLTVNGNSGSSVELYDDDTTLGFHLAGNDIPEPTSAHTNTNKNLTNCQLVWEKRKTSDSPAQEVYLLALKNCSTSSGEVTYDCEWEKGSLMACSIPHNSYCQLVGDWQSIMEVSSCGARGSVATSLAGCPAATPGGICVVREQKTSVFQCATGSSPGSELITACHGRIYNAVCTSLN